MKRYNPVLQLLVAFLVLVTIPLAAMGQSDVVLEPDFIDFGQVAVGASSAPGTITIYNGRPEAIKINEFHIPPEFPDFSVTWVPKTPPLWLASGEFVNVEVTFSPSVAGLQFTGFSLVPGIDDLVALRGVGRDSQIVVSHSAIDFGEVAVGTSRSEVISISSTGTEPLWLENIVIVGDPDFSITWGPTTPLWLAPGSFVNVEVTFSPAVAGPQAATLKVLSDAVTPADDIQLTGMGVVVELPPEEQIADILAFVDTSVEAGTLEGDGPGASAPKRLNALTHMLEAAAGLIEEGLYEEAYGQLMAAYRKTDGAGRPPDFVAGDAASELAEMIQALLDSM